MSKSWFIAQALIYESVLNVGPPQDIVDYLLLIQNEKNASDHGEEMRKLSDDELLQICNDLFFGK